MLAALFLHRWNTDTWNHVTRAVRLDNPARDIEADRVVNLFERNGHYEPVEFTLPDIGAGQTWGPIIDTSRPVNGDDADSVATGATFTVTERCTIVLRKQS